MNKLKVAILFGGCSSEYNVSLMSSSSVIKNIDKNKYELYLIGVTNKGDFYLYNGPQENIENDTWFSDEYCQKITLSCNRSDHGFIIIDTKELIKIDVAFPVMHGMNGEDGRLQGLFELANIPYVGCDMLSSAICMDKYISNELAEKNGIKTAKSIMFDKNDSLLFIKDNIKKFKYPLYIKPLRAGSSIGITRIVNEDGLSNALKEAFKYDSKVIIEEEVKGFEVGCAIMGNKKLITGEVDEIEIRGFFDYDKKYKLVKSTSILPARISETERDKIKETAIKLYKVLGCKDYARIDMFYTEDKEIYFNEVNTIPGFTDHSRFPSMLKCVGYEFSDLVDKLIRMALNDEED